MCEKERLCSLSCTNSTADAISLQAQGGSLKTQRVIAQDMPLNFLNPFHLAHLISSTKLAKQEELLHVSSSSGASMQPRSENAALLHGDHSNGKAAPVITEQQHLLGSHSQHSSYAFLKDHQGKTVTFQVIHFTPND